jgi:hypothetical protein
LIARGQLGIAPEEPLKKLNDLWALNREPGVISARFSAHTSVEMFEPGKILLGARCIHDQRILRARAVSHRRYPAARSAERCIAQCRLQLVDVVFSVRLSHFAVVAPEAVSCPMCEMSKTPTLFRTAWCSSVMLVYCTGISQPPKGTIFAPARRCSS